MDYLDTKKEARNNIMLFIGYGTIAIAIAIATLILVYQAFGFGLARNGTLIQSGLTFFSSQPNPATITIDGVVNKSKTDTRLSLPEKIYHIVLSRTGYRNWERTIQVDGGSVRHYDYPLLFPVTLIPKKIATLPSAPNIFSQSPDRRWLLTQPLAANAVFSVYDLKNIAKDPVSLQIPDAVTSKATGPESWSFSEWADDNNHVVLQHIYDAKTEYILLSRTNPEQSINLTNTIAGTFTKLSLNNRKYDAYYIQNNVGGDLQTATLATPTPVSLFQKVLAYKSYDNDTVLYATPADAAAKVSIKLRVGNKGYVLRTLPAGTNYPLNLTKYNGTLFVVIGASSQNKLYVYRDPIGQLENESLRSLVPTQVLNVVAPDFVSFSANAQYILAENGTQFGVYDIENDKGYNYTAKQPLDAPATHANWMDGNRITYVSGGKMLVFDFDYTNQQSLMPAASTYLPAYSPDFRFIYNLIPLSSDQFSITQTSVRIPTEQ